MPKLKTMSPFRLIINTTWKKQGFFLVGTLILISTWALQNFVIDNNKEKIDDIEKGFNSFDNHLNNLREDQAGYANAALLRKVADSAEYDRRISEVTMQKAADYTALASEEIELIYGEDSVPMANRAYSDSLAYIKNLLEENKWDAITAYVARQKKSCDVAHQIAQDKALDRKKALVKTNRLVKQFAILFYILGTVLVSVNKGLEFLQDQSLVKTTE